MKKSAACAFVLSLLPLIALADDPKPPAQTPIKLDARTEKLVADSLAICGSPSKTSAYKFEHAMPTGMSSAIINVESQRTACNGQYLVITSPRSFYLGQPWLLDGMTGTTEQKLKDFAWKNMQESYTATISKVKDADGLYPVELVQTTEHGKLPLDGAVDPAGTIFFLGRLHPLAADLKSERMKNFNPLLVNMPAHGPSAAKVTVVEFSDFECPSCRYASTTFKPIWDKYADKIRFIRYDLPLVNNHPWAFSAALAGRAIYRQKPDVFWDYKKQVYENQSQLNAFTFDEFARGFAKDHEIDLKKFDADLADTGIQHELMKGVGIAFTNDIRATPSYLINGTLVDSGTDGEALDKYIAAELAK